MSLDFLTNVHDSLVHLYIYKCIAWPPLAVSYINDWLFWICLCFVSPYFLFLILLIEKKYHFSAPCILRLSVTANLHVMRFESINKSSCQSYSIWMRLPNWKCIVLHDSNFLFKNSDDGFKPFSFTFMETSYLNILYIC